MFIARVTQNSNLALYYGVLGSVFVGVLALAIGAFFVWGKRNEHLPVSTKLERPPPYATNPLQ